MRGRAARSALTVAHAGMLRTIEGRYDEALAALAETEALMGNQDWYVASGCAYAAARLRGGDAGRALCAGLLARLREEGFEDPLRGLALQLPVLHLLR